jgi:hypothetical protein
MFGCENSRGPFIQFVADARPPKNAAAARVEELYNGFSVGTDAEGNEGYNAAQKAEEQLKLDFLSSFQNPQKNSANQTGVASANAYTSLGQVQLETADVIRRGRVGRSLEKRSKTFAAADVAPLRARAELARVHVLDHPLAKRADSIDTHKKLLSWMRVDDTSIFNTGRPARYRRSQPRLPCARSGYPRSGLSRSDLVP